MKKTVAILLAALLLSMLCACGTAAPAATPEPAATPATAAEASNEADAKDEATVLRFSTTDRDGNAYDESVFAGYKAVMLNFWEPWCGPCVAEMPELQKLYEAYADQGFLILGIYETEGMEEDVDKVLERTGVTYPILHSCADFDIFKTGYVPTTAFVDGEGRVYQNGVYVGSRDYAGWEALLLEAMS